MEQKRFSFIVAIIAVVIVFAMFAAGAWPYWDTGLKPGQIKSIVWKESPTQRVDESIETKKVEENTNDNSDWQTYRNDEYGFEIEYPADRLVSFYKDKLARFVSGEDIDLEAKCKENESELIRKKAALGPSGCLFGIFISIVDRAALEELYSMAPYGIKSIRDGWYNFFQLNRDYLAPDFAAAIQIESSDKFIVFESFNTQADVLMRMLSTFKFIDGADNGSGLQANLPGNEIYDPLFKKYLAGEKFNGIPAELDFNNDRGLLNFKTRIADAYKAYKSWEYANMLFAGHYVFTFWGCGTSCRAGVIIDLKDGKIYGIPGGDIEASPVWGYYFKDNSNLFIINPVGTTHCVAGTTDENGLLCPDTKFYLWENNQFRKLPIDGNQLLGK